jgi:hypothetical protein
LISHRDLRNIYLCISRWKLVGTAGVRVKNVGMWNVGHVSEGAGLRKRIGSIRDYGNRSYSALLTSHREVEDKCKTCLFHISDVKVIQALRRKVNSVPRCQQA